MADRKEVAMDRDARESDRGDEALQGDTGMIGSEAEEPGPGRDTSLTDPDPVAASTDQPRSTVAMSEGDPMRTRLGSHVEGAGVIGYDVAAAEEGATQQTTPDDRPGYEPERDPGPAAGRPADERDPGLTGGAVDEAPYERSPDERTSDTGLGVAAAGIGLAGGGTGVSAAGPGVAAQVPVDDAGPTDRSVFADESTQFDRPAVATEDAGAGDRSAYADETTRLDTATDTEAPSGASTAGYEGEPGGAGMAGYEGEPEGDAPAAYTGEEADVVGRPEYADRAEGSDRPLYQEEPQRADRPGGGGSLFSDDEPERLDRPGPQEPGVDQGIYDQEADQARRPSDGV
jgi:hypothetical protein